MMKNASIKTFWTTLKFGRPYISHLALGSLLNLVTVGADLGFLYLLKQLIDTGIQSPDLALLKWLALGALGILLLRSIFGYAGGYLSTYVSGRMTNDIQNLLYAKIHRLSIDFHVENTTGNLLTALFFHASNMLQIITSISGTIVKELLRIPALVIFLFYLHTGLAFFALLVFPPALLAVRLFRGLITRTTRQTHETLTQLYTTAEQTLSHMELVKTFAREPQEIAHFQGLNQKMLLQSIQAYKASALSNPVVQMLRMLGITILVFLGAREVPHGNLTIGGLTTFLAAAYYFYGSLSSLASWYLSLLSGLVSADRVLGILSERPSVAPSPGGVKLKEFRDCIEMRKVSFGYPTGKSDILCDINLHIEPGETVAIAGPSGSGKSTLIKLLLRLYDPSKGDICIDGHKLAELDLVNLRGLFGVAPQDPGIFQDSIRAVIAYGRPEANLAEIQEAARHAGAHDFIDVLPKGYNTLIGERGIKLSGGEKQRLALARALVRNPQILILDEALSSVDASLEKAVLQRVSQVRRETTTILISHRLASIAHADRIVVFEGGTIVEAGSHQQLMAGSTRYRKWFLIQQAGI